VNSGLGGLAPAQHEVDLARTLRDALAELVPSAALRAGLDSTEGFGVDAWKAVAGEIGLCGLAVPEHLGGLGLGALELNTVHVELGRALYPGPFLSTSLATTALLASADGPAQERWLPRVAAGELIASVLPDEAAVNAAPGRPAWTLSGTASFVPYGHVAQLLLVPTHSHGWFAVEGAAAGVAVRMMPGLDLTRRLAQLEFHDAPAVPVGQPDAGVDVGAAVAQHLRLALAAEAAGGLDWCLATCVEYAKTRTQFGRPIGSFQAVAHACVQMLEAVQSSTATARWAAHATATNSSEALLAGHVAALRAGEAYRTHTEAAIHLLGGTGFTWEHDAHLYYRRARSALALSGGLSAHRAAIATAAGLDP